MTIQRVSFIAVGDEVLRLTVDAVYDLYKLGESRSPIADQSTTNDDRERAIVDLTILLSGESEFL